MANEKPSQVSPYCNWTLSFQNARTKVDKPNFVHLCSALVAVTANVIIFVADIRYDAQVDQARSARALGPDMASLDLLLERRLCSSLEASGGGLWTLPPPGLPDHILRNHVDDEGLRTLRAFFGAKIFAQAVPSTIEQTFASYPGTVREIIEAQIAKPAVLSRLSARLPIYAHKVSPIIPTAGNCSVPKVQLLYAAVSALSEQHNSDYVTQWLKMLVGNMVPIIMDTVSDWEDANQRGLNTTLGEQAGTEASSLYLTIIDDDDPVEGRSNFELLEDEDDPDRLAELLANHLTGLDATDKEI